MFSFFKKFKQVTDANSDGKGDKDKTGASPVTPTRTKDKGVNREQELVSSCYDTRRTDLAVSTGTKRKDTERRSGEVREKSSVHQRGNKNESVTVKASDNKVPVRETCTTKVMGGVAATMTWSDDTGDIGRDVDLAMSEATSHTNAETSQDKEKSQHEVAGTLTAGNQRNVFVSRVTPVEMGVVTQVDEATPRVPESASSSGSQGKFTASGRQVGQAESEKRSLVNQEARFQEQLAELTAQLTARDNESHKLRYQMEDLQRDVLIKSSGMDRLQAELEAAHKESDCVRRRLRQLEEDLGTFKEKNRELQDELQKKAEEIQSSSDSDSDNDNERVAELESKVKELEEKVQQLQSQLEEVCMERDKLEQARAEMEADREEEIKIIERALEEALEEKALILARFEQDFEKLRTVNTDREQQLLDDFEWKLREVEQACKRRLEEKDKTVEERLREGRKELELKLKLAEQQLKELPQLKTYEAEVIQLRGLTIEQQRSLRVTTRQTEQLQVSERMLKEEITRLRGLLDKEKSHGICMQSLHEKKMADNEKKFEVRLDQQKSDITAQWEDRLRRECSRLRSELDQLHSEEKRLAIESVQVQKEKEMNMAKLNWDLRMQQCLKEISTLKDRLTEKDTYYHGELEKAQTNADQDIFNLRRKLDKIDLSYQEQMEKLTDKYEKEIEQLNWESDRKIQQLEQNWQLQMSSTRATLELVKEQMERDAQDRLDAAEEKHHKQLDIQWERLVNEKEKAVAELEAKHQTQVELIKIELEKASKNNNSREIELLDVIANLKKELQGQTAVVTDLQGNVDLLQGGMQVLNQEISTQNVEMQRIQAQAAHKLREREAQLEAEQRKKLSELKEQFAAESKQWQEQMKNLKEENQQKLNYLAKLIQESEQKYKNRESRKEDLDIIAHLKQVLDERDREVTCLTEEKRFCQLELMNRESTYNHLFGVQPIIGVLDPLHHHRKKGLKDSSGQHQSRLPEARSRQVSSSSVPPFSTRTTSQRQDFLVQKSKSLEPRMVHTKEPIHSKVAETNSLSTDKFRQVMSVVDYISNLVSTEENSTTKICRLQSTDTEPRFNLSSTPDEIIRSESKESPKRGTVKSAEVPSDSSPITNHQTAVTQDCTLTFDAVDVPDSKMSILLQSHKSAENSKNCNFATRSKSVETAGNKVHTVVPSSTSVSSLQ